ncbi:MAG: prolyl-tRNA synthetase associated domain-containing protein [Firmicutes bacterium]|nr:prolyl-tRNA synthetase associated domain-containing protein [Bacillota bacterium]
MEISAREQKVYDIFEEIGVEYQLYRHEAIYTIAAAEELDKKLEVPIAKNLFLSTKHGTEYYMLTLMGHKKFNTGKISKQIGVPRMTFAGEEKMIEFLDIYPGSVTPLGLLNDDGNNVHFLIDSELLNYEKISVHPCVNTATVVIKTKDLLEKILPYCNHDYKEVLVEE